MSRRPLIIGNWKMNKTVSETQVFIKELVQLLARADGVSDSPGVDLGLSPTFLSLQAAVEAAKGSAVKIYAQNMHEADSGAFTGEISAPMLNELGVDGVILGHSERRQYFGESDRALQLKVPHALSSGLSPVLCVGETEGERDHGETERKLRNQVQEALEEVPVTELADVVIAYEPIWAIGTGQVATVEQAQDASSFIRALVSGFDKDAAQSVRILYGGSVNPSNAGELLSQPDIDGALVGGASLEPASFEQIVQACLTADVVAGFGVLRHEDGSKHYAGNSKRG